MKSERRCIKMPTIKTIVLVMTLGVLLMQLVGCSGTSSTPVISSSSTNSHGSLSDLNSEAYSIGIDAWIATLNSRQGTPDNYIDTTVSNMDPSAVSQALSKGNSVIFTWESISGRAVMNGEMEIKNFRSFVSPVIGINGISEADKANGITWKGDVNISFIMRYRSVTRWGNDVNTDDLSSKPFSPWEDHNMSIALVRQNGEWTTRFSCQSEIAPYQYPYQYIKFPLAFRWFP